MTMHLSGFLLHVIIYHMVITTFMQAALHNNPCTSRIPVSNIWTLIRLIAVWCLPLLFKRWKVVTVIRHLDVMSRYKQDSCLLDIISIVLLCYLAALMRNWQWWTVCWRCQCMSQVSNFRNMSSYSDAQVHKTSAQCHCCSSFRSLLAMCLLYYYPLITYINVHARP